MMTSEDERNSGAVYPRRVHGPVWYILRPYSSPNMVPCSSKEFTMWVHGPLGFCCIALVKLISVVIVFARSVLSLHFATRPCLIRPVLLFSLAGFRVPGPGLWLMELKNFQFRVQG